jgi:hypothetical protein
MTPNRRHRQLSNTATESPISMMIPSRTIFSSVTNERAIRRIERAITQCLMQHEGCPRGKVNILPSRVIDVEIMCLHETEGRETGTYAALSYCWGGDQLVKTTSANIPSKRSGIALEGLPQTLQDAVQVCRQLTIRYLWIDALCIIQDDESDKAREISQMALIYNRATLVIAASRAKSVYDGFLADIEVHPEGAIMLPARFSKTCEGEIGILKVPMESSGREPLNQRGWTYQEISLASRALIYTEGGIIWQCNTIFDRLAFDGIQMGSHPSEDLVVATKEFEAGTLQRVEWDQVVRIYTLRSLTYPDDRLEAVAGIAAIAAPLWNSRYYAGLWEQDMEIQLGWRLDDSALLYDWKWREPQAPSWSWASVDGPVCNVVQFVRSETPRGARVISCEVTLAYPENSFGRVLSGRLTIEAFLVQARQANPSWLADTRMDSNAKSVKEEDLDDIWCLLLGCAPDNGMEADEFPQWDGLLLSCLPDGTFKRLGHFRQDLDRENWMDDEVSFDEYYSELEDEQLLGPEARFPVGGSRRTVIIV